jgi:alkanesulfonate monooxygenase SsuD/methylene tetrahydromethanopterin reductase-like flavin-dependent oxidoreductase (luciferase family)
MEIGISAGARQLPDSPRPLVDIYRQLLDEAVLGEELGFSSWWIEEHHFAPDQYNPSQFPLLAAVAARTRRIRLGTYVLLLALHNPLRVAEDAATVDILSNGRLDLAIGAGPLPMECAVFGIPSEERYGRTYEALEVLQRCFTEEVFDHHGRYYDFAGVRLTTKPVQFGGPPILMAAQGPQSLVRAGTRGYHLASAIHTPLIHLYTEAQTRAGRSRADYRLVSGPITVHLADTRERAWDECERAFHWRIAFYRPHGLEMPLPPVREMRDTPDMGIFGQPFAVGTPDDVMAVLRRYSAFDLDEIVIQFNHPGMEARLVRRSMELFAREVMPEIALWGGSPSGDRAASVR